MKWSVNHWQYWPALIFGLALVLRLAGLGNEPLWFDESFTALVARLPFPQVLAAVSADVHPPLFYLFEWLLSHLTGQSEFMLRFPSAVFSACAALELYKLVDYVVGQKEARLAGFLAAVMPAQISYGQDARSYALLTFLVLLSLRAVLQRNWIRAWLGLVLALYTHNLAIVYVLVIGVVALVINRKQATLLGLGVALAYAPWGITALGQTARINQHYWIPMPTPGTLLVLFSNTTFYSRLPEWLVIPIAVLTIGLTVAALVALRPDWRKAAPLIALLIVPPVVELAISALWQPIYLDRTLLPGGAAVVALWGIALARIGRWERWLAAGILAPVLAISLAGYYSYSANNDFNWRILAARMRARWQPCDAIYHADLETYVDFDFYLPGANYLMPAASYLSAMGFTNETESQMGIRRMNFEDVARSHCRIWVFTLDPLYVSTAALSTEKQITESYPVILQMPIPDKRYAFVHIYLISTR